ncbi:MAG: hypothetical protein Fur0037_26850 [Planctomycetota bacterium]
MLVFAGVMALGTVFSFGDGWFSRTLFLFAVPVAAGLFLLGSDAVHDLATENARRSSEARGGRRP